MQGSTPTAHLDLLAAWLRVTRDVVFLAKGDTDPLRGST